MKVIWVCVSVFERALLWAVQSVDSLLLRMHACIHRAISCIDTKGSFTCASMTHSRYTFARTELIGSFLKFIGLFAEYRSLV